MDLNLHILVLLCTTGFRSFARDKHWCPFFQRCSNTKSIFFYWLLLSLTISDLIVDPATRSGTFLRLCTLQARTPERVYRRVYITGAWQRQNKSNEDTMQHDAVSRDAMMRLGDRDYAVKAEYTDALRELTSARVDAPIKARIQVDQ